MPLTDTRVLELGPATGVGYLVCDIDVVTASSDTVFVRYFIEKENHTSVPARMGVWN